jgi:hypothetical protein
VRGDDDEGNKRGGKLTEKVRAKAGTYELLQEKGGGHR